jgi:oxalate---CoA ligase
LTNDGLGLVCVGKMAFYPAAGMGFNTTYAVTPATTECVHVSDLLKAGARVAGHASALVASGECAVGHGQLVQLVERAGVDLAALGVGRHVRVMTALPDGLLAALALLSVTSHAVCAPINPDLREGEVELLIPELRPDVLVAHGVVADAARAAARRAGLSIVEVTLSAEGCLKWEGATGLPPLSQGPPSADDVALVLLTSGSSARPKRVPLTHRQLTLAAGRVASSLELRETDVCLNLMPMFHVGAVVDLLLAPLAVGGTVVRPSEMSVNGFYDALATHQPTWFQGVPTLLHEVARHAERRLGTAPSTSLRLVRSVSSPLPTEWREEIEQALAAPVIEIYGMTETAGLITSNPLPPLQRKMGSVGRVTGLEVKVDAPAGERGEILVRGAGVMGGYERVADAQGEFSADGWLRTGDEGYVDEDGYWFITGRIVDQINRGGEKISPREVDEVLLSHPALKEAAAFPLSHPKLGQEVAAALVWKDGVSVSVDELMAHVGARLAHFKVPKTWYAVEALPRGPGGKLRRRLLPEQVSQLTALPLPSLASAEQSLTPRERQVAEWWERELQVTGVGRQADFFELGGDSLAAVGFTVGIEKQLGLQVKPAALFDHPTVASFAAYLDEALGSGGGVSVSAAHGNVLKPELLRMIQAAVDVWPGGRLSQSSLFVGRNTAAQGLPIFWCGQGRNEYQATAAAWPAEYPFFATRSLFLFNGKTKEDERALAQVMADEVDVLRSGRAVVLGGFCAGGRIAFEAARLLRERGVPVKLVFTHEAWSSGAIDVPVVMSFCKGSVFSPRRKFSRPEMAMNKRFSAGGKSWEIDTSHIGLFEDLELMRQVTAESLAVLDGTRPLHGANGMTEVPPQACRARLSARVPRAMRAGETLSLQVDVKNDSQRDWPASSVSGLHLGWRWLDADGQCRDDPGLSAAFANQVLSKASTRVQLPVQAPPTTGSYLLELDVVDEGIRWFSERRGASKPSISLRVPVKVTEHRAFAFLPHPLHSSP